MGQLLFIFKNLMARNERGQGMVEYGLIIALVAIVVIGALILIGQSLNGIFTDINNSLQIP